jgi:hypothetical protein
MNMHCIDKQIFSNFQNKYGFFLFECIGGVFMCSVQ